ncbi:MAG: Uma2 family endonuclease [Gemmataceae bacterium]
MPAVATRRIETGIVLENITWQTYERLLREVGERPIRLTYDHGDLEIMTLSHGHEKKKRILGRCVDFLTFELNIPMASGGSNTLRWKLKKRGLEPDECYWFKHEKAMRGKDEFEPNVDPSPDLALEIDVTSSCMDRMAIYAALGILEVWRYYRRRLRVYRLTEEKKYEESEESAVFPFLHVHELERFIHRAEKEDETTVMHEYVAWLRAEVVPAFEKWKAKGNGRRKTKGD